MIREWLYPSLPGIIPEAWYHVCLSEEEYPFSSFVHAVISLILKLGEYSLALKRLNFKNLQFQNPPPIKAWLH
jgi:hypothetical protein